MITLKTNRALPALTLVLSACGAGEHFSVDQYLRTPGAFIISPGSDGAGMIFSACQLDQVKTRCLIDSGADIGMVYNYANRFDAYEAKDKRPLGSLSGQDSAVALDYIDLQEVQFAGQNFKSKSFVRSDFFNYPVDLASSGLRALVGANVLFSGVLNLNFDSNRIFVNKSKEEPELDLDLEVSPSGHVIVPASLAGANILGVWDTGAGLTVVDKKFVDLHKSEFQYLRHSTGQDLTGVELRLSTYRAPTLQFGRMNIENSIVVVADLSSLREHFKIDIQAIFGFNHISRGNWIIDRAKRKWTVSPTKKK